MTGEGEWLARLLVAFGGDLAGWAWTGEVREDPECRGTCACGHTGLRYLFPWRKDGAGEVITGSVCVYNLPGIAPDQVARVRVEVERREDMERQEQAAVRLAQRTESAETMAEEIRRLWPRVYELEARQRRGEALPPEAARLLRQEHDLHEDFRSAIRLRTPQGRIKKLATVRRAILRGLGEPLAAEGAGT